MMRTRTAVTETNTIDTNKLLADPLLVSIVDALGHASELSFSELMEMFNIGRQQLEDSLLQLVEARIVAEHERWLGSKYYSVGKPDLLETCHILYELWGQEARCPRSRRTLGL